MNKNNKGFTLIELLVVIAIIGLLSTLSVLALNSARARSRDAKRISDIKQIQTALEMYYNEAGYYPADGAVDAGDTISTGTNVYMKVVPTAPIPVDGGCSAAQNTYTYDYLGSGTEASGSYTLTYCLGAATGGVPAGVNTATPSGIR